MIIPIRRRRAPVTTAPAVRPHGPFAALAALKR
jgi:hypothetical protein